MSTFASRARFLVDGVLTCLIGVALTAGAGAQQKASVPDFSSDRIGWISVGNDFIAPPDGPRPVTFDPAHPYVPNGTGAQPTYRIGDLTNPNLRSWVKERMKKDNDEILAGKIGYTARSSCAAAGVPGFLTYPVRPVYFIQAPKQVVMVYSGDAQVRRVYLNVPHSENPQPTWYGESVGHYEGDTLVVDTIGMNDKTFVDNYRTPHTTKLHVVERWRVVEEGKTLEVTITVADPDAFNEPWSAVRRYRRVQEKMAEEVCAENNQHLFDYHIPVANKPDF